MGVDVIRLTLDRLFEARDAFVELALVFEHQAQIVARFEIARFDLEGAAMIGLGVPVPAEGAQRVAEIGMATRIVRIERDGAPVAGNGSVKGAFGTQCHPHIIERLGIFGIDLERGDISGDGVVEAAVLVGGDRLVELLLRALGAFSGALAHKGPGTRPLVAGIHMMADQLLGNLYRIERRTFAQIVRYHPHVEAVHDALVLAEARDIDRVLAGAIARRHIAAILAFIEHDDAGRFR